MITHGRPLLLIRNKSLNLCRFSDLHVSYNVMKLWQWLERSLKQCPELLSPHCSLGHLVGYSIVSNLHQLWLATLIAKNVYLFFYLKRAITLKKLLSMWSPLTDTTSFGAENNKLNDDAEAVWQHWKMSFVFVSQWNHRCICGLLRWLTSNPNYSHEVWKWSRLVILCTCFVIYLLNWILILSKESGFKVEELKKYYLRLYCIMENLKHNAK